MQIIDHFFYFTSKHVIGSYFHLNEWTTSHTTVSALSVSIDSDVIRSGVVKTVIGIKWRF